MYGSGLFDTSGCAVGAEAVGWCFGEVDGYMFTKVWIPLDSDGSEGTEEMRR